jgi:hypothetical protein
MEMVELKVQMPKQMMELGQGLAGVVKAVKQAKSDVVINAADLPQLVMDSIRALIPAIEGVDQLPEEVKADPGKLAFALAMVMDEAL